MDYEMKSPLEVRGLCKNYPAFKLEDVSFSLVPGTITGFIANDVIGLRGGVDGAHQLLFQDLLYSRNEFHKSPVPFSAKTS